MGQIQVNMTELRQCLGNLVNRAAYGGERIVLVSHGEPKAAIVSIEDLQRLQQSSVGFASHHDHLADVLTKVDRLREQIWRWQQAQGIESPDTTETLSRLREGRDHELAGLR